MEAKSHVFRGHSDTEVLLNLYLDQGEEMFTRLNGIFAFALWDGRTDMLLVARDGLGVKPLYYAESLQGFVFRERDQGVASVVVSKGGELGFGFVAPVLGVSMVPR